MEAHEAVLLLYKEEDEPSYPCEVTQASSDIWLQPRRARTACCTSRLVVVLLLTLAIRRLLVPGLLVASGLLIAARLLVPTLLAAVGIGRVRRWWSIAAVAAVLARIVRVLWWLVTHEMFSSFPVYEHKFTMSRNPYLPFPRREGVV